MLIRFPFLMKLKMCLSKQIQTVTCRIRLTNSINVKYKLIEKIKHLEFQHHFLNMALRTYAQIIGYYHLYCESNQN